MTNKLFIAATAAFLLASQASASAPAAVTVPFSLSKNLIVVEAEVNGVAGNYLVDTGAQAMILNEPRFENADVETVVMGHAPPSGVGGAMQDVKGARNLQLAWGDVQLDGLMGMVTDLTHLENSIGTPVAGIIGFNALEQFQIEFDYAAGELTLYRLGENSRPLVPSDRGAPALTTDFELEMHIPVFDVEIAGRTLRMGLDSGAGQGMLFERWQEPLDGHYEFITRDGLRGGDRNVQMGDVVRLDNMRVANLDYPDLRFRFNDIAAHNGRAVPMDGLLGFEFLERHPTAINFRTGELMIWSTN